MSKPGTGGYAIKSLEPIPNVDDWLCNGEIERCAEERWRASLRNSINGDLPGRVVCDCAEGTVNGKRVAVHRPEDCRYTEARSALVDDAARITTEKIGDPLHDSELGRRWTAEFVKILNKMAEPLLRQSNGAHTSEDPPETADGAPDDPA
jgi:hypothetical protein